jgi:hypothetical protein
MLYIGHYVDPAEYYETAAEHCAKQEYTNPMLVRALLDLPEEVLEQIESEPHTFARRVAEYAYGIAMSKIDES